VRLPDRGAEVSRGHSRYELPARSIGTLTRKGSKWSGIARPKRYIEGPNDGEWQVGFVTHEWKAAENPVYAIASGLC
jgi:hypothetical protein